MKNLEAFMITIEGNQTSEYYADYCKPSWENYGIHIKTFAAVTPKTLHKHRQLRFTKYSTASKYVYKNIKALITDTEKSCWYSHFLLWQECCYLNKPIMILEHDSFLEYPENLWYDASYGIIFYDKAAMGSYIIQPWFANTLVHYCMSTTISCGPYAIINELAKSSSSFRKTIVDINHPMYKPSSNQVMSNAYGNTIIHYSDLFPEHWPKTSFHKFKQI